MANIPKKHGIERLLQQVRPHPSPRIELEQYTIPANMAADILLLASAIYHDIVDKVIVDLGTGTGRLAIGAAILGAREVTGIDIDPIAISVARKNSDASNVNVDWIVGDVNTIHGCFDTVIMNPPFGTKKRHVDKVFLRKAIQIGRIIYSIHKSTTRDYILKYVERCGCRARAVHEYAFEIPRMFKHHKKRGYQVRVDCYRIEAKLVQDEQAR